MAAGPEGRFLTFRAPLRARRLAGFSDAGGERQPDVAPPVRKEGSSQQEFPIRARIARPSWTGLDGTERHYFASLSGFASRRVEVCRTRDGYGGRMPYTSIACGLPDGESGWDTRTKAAFTPKSEVASKVRRAVEWYVEQASAVAKQLECTTGVIGVVYLAHGRPKPRWKRKKQRKRKRKTYAKVGFSALSSTPGYTAGLFLAGPDEREKEISPDDVASGRCARQGMTVLAARWHHAGGPSLLAAEAPLRDALVDAVPAIHHGRISKEGEVVWYPRGARQLRELATAFRELSTT